MNQILNLAAFTFHASLCIWAHRECTDLFLAPFPVQDVSIFLSTYGSLRQSLLFVKAAERVRVAISPNYHISWRPFNPGVSYEQMLFSDLFRLNL